MASKKDFTAGFVAGTMALAAYDQGVTLGPEQEADMKRAAAAAWIRYKAERSALARDKARGQP